MNMTHREIIKNNIHRFDSGEWNKFTFADFHQCSISWVEAILNEVLEERIRQSRWENMAEGVPLPEYDVILLPSVIEVHPTRVIELGGNKVQVIYESKMNNHEHNI
jgi:hypothetical protein